MTEIVRLQTTLRSDEAALLTELASSLQTTRAGALRAMARYAMDHQDDFRDATRPLDDEDEDQPFTSQQAFDLASQRLAYEVRRARFDLPREYAVWTAACAAYDGPDATSPTFSPEAHQYADACLAAIGERRPGPEPLQFDDQEYDDYSDRHRQLAYALLVFAAIITLVAIVAGSYAL